MRSTHSRYSKNFAFYLTTLNQALFKVINSIYTTDGVLKYLKTREDRNKSVLKTKLNKLRALLVDIRCLYHVDCVLVSAAK